MSIEPRERALDVLTRENNNTPGPGRAAEMSLALSGVPSGAARSTTRTGGVEDDGGHSQPRHPRQLRRGPSPHGAQTPPQTGSV